MNKNQLVAFHNKKDEPVSVLVEPWAHEIALEPDQALTLKFSGPPDQTLELHIEERTIVVFGWEGSNFEVLT